MLMILLLMLVMYNDFYDNLSLLLMLVLLLLVMYHAFDAMYHCC